MIAFDTGGILHLLDPNANAAIDHSTNLAVTDCQKRMQFYVSEMHKKREKILVPTPVLGELLILASTDGPSIYSRLSKSAAFQIEPFDDRAAIELCLMTESALKAGDRRAGSTESMAKIKFDRQIIAIAKVHHARAIFSDDKNIRKFATANGVNPIAIWELPLPPVDAQTTLWEHLRDENETK